MHQSNELYVRQEKLKSNVELVGSRRKKSADDDASDFIEKLIK